MFMKKNGFITSALLYGIMVLFLMLMLGTLSILGNRKLASDKLKEDALNDVQTIETPASCFQTILNENEEITITGYSASCEKTVFIPKTINGTNVTVISNGAFANQKIKSIWIDSNIKEIGDNAFIGNDKITFVIKQTKDTIVSGFPWGATNYTLKTK